MFKKLILLLFIIFSICSCNNNSGDSSQVTKIIPNSNIYTKQDIENAMNVVTDYFKNAEGFQYCTLTELCYDEKISSEESAAWAKQYEAEQAIVLLSKFDVSSSYKSGGLEANKTYQNFKWVLVRSGQEIWILETWGY